MKRNCNVFKYFSYGPRYYLRHPFEWIGDKWRSLKWAKQRATRGYADCDTWNIDSWFMSVMPDMLEQLATETDGWPDNRFETFEDWQQWLRDTAAAIRMMREEEQNAVNPYWKAYEQELYNWQYEDMSNEVFNQYQTSATLIAAKAQLKFEEAMAQFVKYFSCLWY